MTQLVITHADGTTLSKELIDGSLSITWIFPGRVVEPRTKAAGTISVMNDGLTKDPNNGYRVVSCGAMLTAAEIVTLNAKMLPAAIPTYDATDPKIVLELDGNVGNNLTILCVITSPLKAIWVVDNQYRVGFIFTERTV